MQKSYFINLKIFKQPISSRRDLHEQFHCLFHKHMPAGAVVYDVGCGQKPFKDVLASRVASHIGVDLADGFYRPDQVDVIGSAYAIPVPDSVADAVILSQVLEHLENPLLAMQEAHRLLRPDGLMFLSFPFMYPVHAPPRDFLRYTEYYLKQELAGQGFELVEVKRLGGFWYLMGLYAAMYLQDMDRGPLRLLRLAKLASMLTGLLCLGLHKLEGCMLRAIGKDAERIRARWTANYVAVLRKL